MKRTLDGKLAIVTGGSGLLGQQHCIALAEIGSKVIILEKNVKNSIKFINNLKSTKYYDHIKYFKSDITNYNKLKKVSKNIYKEFGKVDILINNAANNPPLNKKNFNNLKNFDHKAWNDDLNVGLTGALNCTLVFGEIMTRYNEGVILNIASDLSVIAPDQRLYNNGTKIENAKPVSYSVVKSGIVGMTKYFATYWNNYGIRVNALSPGGVYDGQNNKFVNKVKKLIPMNRMANKDEYKGAIQFLCSDDSKYMTGQNIIIDGGRSVW